MIMMSGAFLFVRIFADQSERSVRFDAEGMNEPFRFGQKDPVFGRKEPTKSETDKFIRLSKRIRKKSDYDPIMTTGS